LNPLIYLFFNILIINNYEDNMLFLLNLLIYFYLYFNQNYLIPIIIDFLIKVLFLIIQVEIHLAIL
jgi:hypothetical protein